MNFLVVSSRYPWPPFTGDRLRALAWIDALSTLGDVTLVTSAVEKNVTTVTSRPERLRVIGAGVSPAGFVASGFQTLWSGLPFHSLIAAGRGWRDAIPATPDDRDRYDAAVIMLSRLEPWVRGSVRARRVIVDAVDSLTESVAERSRHATGPARLFWGLEVERTRALEESLGSLYDSVVVVNEAERHLFGANSVTIPNSVEIHPFAPEAARDFDFGFWGRLGYFANRDAAAILRERVWPRIRAAQPQARLLVAGADAPREILAAHGLDGVHVDSPMEDRPALLRRVRIALFPIRFGTGQLTKVLEAAEAGCAIVATSTAMRGLDHLKPCALIEDAPEKLADAAIALSADPERAKKLGEGARHVVESHDSRGRTLELMRALATGGAAA